LVDIDRYQAVDQPRNDRSVSRVLYDLTIAATIRLRCAFPRTCSDLPAEIAGEQPLCCLILLPARFTMPPAVTRGPVSSYPTVSPLLHRSEAVWFLWHFLSPRWGRPGVTRCRALWSPDFPPEPARTPAVARPAVPRRLDTV